MRATPSVAGLAGTPHILDMTEALRRGRRRLMIPGVLSLILGIVAIAVPAVASVAIAIFIGWILAVAAGLLAFDAFAVQHGGRRALRLLVAALTFGFGLYLLLAPLDGTFTLTVILAGWFVAVGMARLVFGIAELGVPGAGMSAFLGALDLALGVLIAVQLPSSADWAIGLIVGIDLVFSGVALIALSRALGRLAG